jgi:hypothetical protein
MVAFHQDGEHQSGVIGPRGLPKPVIGPTRTFRNVRYLVAIGGRPDMTTPNHRDL